MYCGEYNKYNVIICGTGATGSQLIPFVTQLLSYQSNCKLTFIDGDRVEMKNLKNQKFLKKDDGMSKSSILQERYKKVYPGLDVNYMDTYIKSQEDLLPLFDEDVKTLNILVGCVDNNPTRKIMRDLFHNESIKQLIYIDSGNGTESMQGQIVVGYKDIVGCRTDGKSSYNESILTYFTKVVAPCAGDIFKDIVEDLETVDHVTSCSYVGDSHPQNIATNILAASVIFGIINQIICFANVPTGITYFDAKNQSVTYREVYFEQEAPLNLEMTIESETISEFEEGDTIFVSQVSLNIPEDTVIPLGDGLVVDNGMVLLIPSDPVAIINTENKSAVCNLSDCEVLFNSKHKNVVINGSILKPYLKSALIEAIDVCTESEKEGYLYLASPKVTACYIEMGEESFTYGNLDPMIIQYDDNGHIINE